MAGPEEAKENKSAIGSVLRPNGQGWTPEKYVRMYLYVWLYNKVAGNPKDFGLPNSNDNSIITNYIKAHYKELLDKYDFKGKLSTLDPSYGDYFHKFFESRVKDGKSLPSIFENEIGEYDSHALEFSTACGKEKGQMISAVDATEILKELKADRRKVYENVRRSVEYKIGNIDKSSGKDLNGYTAVAFEEAKKMRRQKLRPLNFARLKQLGFGALTVVAGAATLTGLGAFLGIGGAFLGGVGATFSALGALGGTLAGLATSIAGFFVSKTFLGKFIERRREKIKAKKEYKEFMRGEGKYALKDGKFMSYRERKKELAMLWQERWAFENYKGQDLDEYAKIIRKKFKLLDPAKVSRILGDIKSTYDTTEVNGICQTVLSNFGVEAAREDKHNNNTVNDYKNRTAALIDPSRDKPATIFELANELDQLKSGPTTEMFAKQQATDTHRALQDQLNDAIVQGIKSFASKPFTSTTKKEIDNALSDKRIKEAVENTQGGGDLKELQSLTKLIGQETGEGKLLDTELGVTIKEQLSTDRETLYGACERLGIESTPKSIVQMICKKIGEMKTQKDSVAIENEISTKVKDDKVRTYLEFMLDRQTKQSKVDTSALSFDAALKGAIDDLIELDDNKAIEAQIKAIEASIDAITDDAKQKTARSIFDNQMEALAFKRKVSNTYGSFETLNELADENVIDHFDVISKLNAYSKGFDKTPDVLTLISALEKIPDKKVGKYMQIKLNEKVERAYRDYIKMTDLSGDIEGIKALFIDINGSLALNIHQKKKLVGMFGESLENALMSEFRNLHESLFAGTATLENASATATKLANEYRKYLTEKMTGKKDSTGFKEYFDLKTPESNALKSKIEFFISSISLMPSLLGNSAKYGAQAPTFDSTSKESREVLRIFYGGDGRVAGDKLYEIANDISLVYSGFTASDSTFKDTFVAADMHKNLSEDILKVDASDPTKMTGGLLHQFKQQLEAITGSSMNKEDKAVALIILKKKCVALFRAQMARDIYGHGEGTELTEYIRDHARGIASEQLKIYNQYLFTDIDKEIQSLRTAGVTIFESNINEEITKGLRNAAEYQKMVTSTTPSIAATLGG